MLVIYLPFRHPPIFALELPTAHQIIKLKVDNTVKYVRGTCSMWLTKYAIWHRETTVAASKYKQKGGHVYKFKQKGGYVYQYAPAHCRNNTKFKAEYRSKSYKVIYERWMSVGQDSLLDRTIFSTCTHKTQATNNVSARPTNPNHCVIYR